MEDHHGLGPDICPQRHSAGPVEHCLMNQIGSSETMCLLLY